MSEFKEINIETFEGSVPPHCDLVIMEKGDKTFFSALVVYFNEVGLFESEFKNPVYGFLSV